MKGLTISQVAKQVGVNVETVRYYERLGLISKPPRTESGYRLFPHEVIGRIKFIKRAQELGFTLSEINKLLGLADSENFDCHEVRQFASQKLREIESKIRDLEKIKIVLQDLSSRCPGQGSISQCPIIETLSGEGGG
ncbi:Hg(II)-responsive transcriptional regulator [Calderihabitans maritimus]|uniref:Hg(II)-responsive transcriptional regulator n=1 Tax=Calderihabitans maritimus TaxID=1246530 RepID=UPI001EDCED27|nr:Hg(II)-responsive transcriptional regulator [Calderihabitans maritimus]